MHIDWETLFLVVVVSAAASVSVVTLVAFAIVGLSARAEQSTPGSDDTRPALPPATGTAIGATCLVATALIVCYGLYVITF